MGIGISIFLLAAGAVLTFAVNAAVEGVDLAAVGVVLMIVGGIGLLYTLVLADAWRGRGDDTDKTVVREREVV